MKFNTLLFISIICFSSCFLNGQKPTPDREVSFDYEKIERKLTAVLNYQPHISNQKETRSFIPKMLEKTKEEMANSNGQINVGYSYGLNTVFTDTSRGIGSIFTTSGSISSSVLNLPVQLSYNYSTLKMPLGANNYFRISFDKQRYLENQKKKLGKQINQIEEIEHQLSQNKSVLNEIQGYTEVFLDMLQRKIEREKQRLIQQRKQKVKDSLAALNNSSSHDASNLLEEQSKPSQEDIAKSDSHKEHGSNDLARYKKSFDSIQKIYQKLQKAQENCTSLIRKYESSKEKLMSMQDRLQHPEIDSLGNTSIDKTNFVKSIQKIDIGLTYPKTTALSDQNTAIKGIGTEFQYENYYLAISSGLTMNNMMLTNNEITNQLDYQQNVFNQFDFQEVKNNGVLTAIKTGIGKPEETHAFIGFNYLTNTRFFNGDDNLGSPYDPAAAVELDLRYVPLIYEGGVLDVVYGKTSANNKLDSLQRSEVFGTLFSRYRSNTLMIKYGQNISKIRSNFSIQYRSLDPNANTTVYGMMQPGNRRIAFESRHRVLPYLRFGTTYKVDESFGTDRYMNLKTTGVNVSGNYKGYLTYSTMINYVRAATEKETGDLHKRTSYLAGIHLQSYYKAKGLKGVVGMNYNDYLFADTSGTVKYTQFGVSKMIGNKKWSSSFKYDYFFQTRQGVDKGTHVYSIGGKYKRKIVKLEAGISMSLNKNTGSSLGGHLECAYKVSKKMGVSMRAERFVMGDFYTNYYRTLYNQLPYLFTLNTSFNF